MKFKFTLFFLSAFPMISLAQDVDLDKLLDDATPKTKEYVSATFKGTRLINFHTVETPGKKSLDFRISHHFGDFNSGAYNFFGLDGGASIRLGLEYSYDGRLEIGVGRSSLEKMFDGFLKYRLLRQTTDDKIPMSVTLFTSTYYTSIKDPNKETIGVDKYQYTSSRFSYASQIIIARKFNSNFSFQISPTLIHYNIVDKLGDKNDLYAVAIATRYKYSKRSAVTFEYAYRINKYSVEKYYDSVGLGIDIETGGHVFQMFITNSLGMAEPQFIGHTTSTWKDFGLKLGFNISRMFNIPNK